MRSRAHHERGEHPRPESAINALQQLQHVLLPFQVHMLPILGCLLQQAKEPLCVLL